MRSFPRGSGFGTGEPKTATAELLEVPEALVAPGRGVGGLDAELRENRLEALVVHGAPQPLPRGYHRPGRLGAAGVVAHQPLPEGPARARAVVPRQAVEPEQEVLGARGRIVEGVADRLPVLIDGAAPPPRPVEPDPVPVGPMVVDRGPVLAAWVGVLGHRRVVVAADQVVKAERHRVVDQRLARPEHQRADHRAHPAVVVRPRHARSTRRRWQPRRGRGSRPGVRTRTSWPGRSGARSSWRRCRYWPRRPCRCAGSGGSSRRRPAPPASRGRMRRCRRRGTPSTSAPGRPGGSSARGTPA